MDIGFINKFKGKCPLYAHKLSIKAAMLKSKGISVGDSFKIKDMVINVVKAIGLLKDSSGFVRTFDCLCRRKERK